MLLFDFCFVADSLDRAQDEDGRVTWDEFMSGSPLWYETASAGGSSIGAHEGASADVYADNQAKRFIFDLFSTPRSSNPLFDGTGDGNEMVCNYRYLVHCLASAKPIRVPPPPPHQQQQHHRGTVAAATSTGAIGAAAAGAAAAFPASPLGSGGGGSGQTLGGGGRIGRR